MKLVFGRFCFCPRLPDLLLCVAMGLVNRPVGVTVLDDDGRYGD